MNDEKMKRIEQTAFDFAAKETKFANMKVVSVDETSDYDEQNGPCFAVKLALSHSVEEIERLVSESDPDESEITREFLKGDFVLNLVVAGESVVASEWENMDIC